MKFESQEAIEIKKEVDGIESIIHDSVEQLENIKKSLPDQEKEKLDEITRNLAHVYGRTDNIRVSSTNINDDSYTDGLTRLFNRKALDEYLNNIQHETYLIFMDLNNFKKANDEMGHEVGDGALKELGDLLLGKELEGIRRHIYGVITSRTKADDLVVRYGGDEFIVVPEKVAEKDTAVKIAYRLKNSIDANFERFNSEYGTEIGVSVGIAKLNPGKISIKETKENADEAMYASKELKHLENQPIAIYDDGVVEYALLDNNNILYLEAPKSE
jgi:diguanylate cyclase (GGDEF)-like protein